MGSSQVLGPSQNASLETQLIKAAQRTPSYALFAVLGRTSLQPIQIGYWVGLGPKVPLPSGPHQCHAHLGESRPTCALEEEAWLNVHLDKLVAKGVDWP